MFPKKLAAIAGAIALLMGIAMETQAATTPDAKHYIRVGGNPVYRNRPIAEGEKVQTISQDRWVATIDGGGKTLAGWLRAGTEVVTIATNDPSLRKAVWIRLCGNPILNSGESSLLFRVAPPVVPVAATPPLPAPVMVAAPAPPKPKPVEPVVAAPAPPQPPPPPDDKKCLGWGTVMAGTGTGMMTYGIQNLYNPVGIVMTAVGALIEIGSFFVEDSDPRCKAAAGIIGGVAGGITGAYVPLPKPHPAAATQPQPDPPPHTLPGNGPPSAPGGGNTLPVNGGGYTPPLNPITGHTLPID